MRKIRVYVDTSVFGGTQDEEFAAASQRFFRACGKANFWFCFPHTPLMN